MRLAGKGPWCGATLFSLIGVTRTSKVQLHRRTARIFIDVIRLHCACEQIIPDSCQVPWQGDTMAVLACLYDRGHILSIENTPAVLDTIRTDTVCEVLATATDYI